MNICVFGDSVTYGVYDQVNGGWVTLLRNYFEEKYEGDIHTYNLGICGDNTEDLLKRFKNETTARVPEVIVFAIGINDSQFIYSKNDYRIEENHFKKNIKELFKLAREITSKIIFIGLTSVDEKKMISVPLNVDKDYKNERINIFDKFIEGFCLENKVKFISVNSLLDNGDLDDGLHPNTMGYKKMFELIKPVVEELIS